MATIDIYDTPMHDPDAYRVDYVVPARQYILDRADEVWAAPGDHVHGYKHPTGVELSVFDAATCPCNDTPLGDPSKAR